MNRLLIIEDDPAILKALTVSLQDEHYTIETANDGLDGFEKAQKGAFDLIILDLMLPGLNGADICKKLRSENNNALILVLTSKNDELDKVVMLELGADDYMVKPPALRELQARVKALLRRTRAPGQNLNTFTFGNFTLDFERWEASKNSIAVKLTSKEYEVMRLLIEKEGLVISRDELLNKVWGYESFPTTRTVDNFILTLRKKIEDDPRNPQHLITVHGAGYKFIT